MFFLKEPSNDQISRFIFFQRELPFSYPEVGATRQTLPEGYTIDRNRIKLGVGEEVYARAVAAIKEWKQFDLGWVKVVPSGTPLEVGSVVSVLTRQFGLWSLNACRVVYLFDETAPLRKFGFAYGTLDDHVEQGEERFTIEWHPNDEVWYDILAFSRPNKLIVKLGLPLTRMLQKRFARDSKRRMVESVSDQDER
jgi:uncharacterized protein (UPF0548 family)